MSQSNARTSNVGNAGGDLSGTYPNPTVIKLNGNAVSSTVLGATQDGYILSWSNGSSQWQANPVPTATGTASGDLSGTYPSPSVVKMQGKTLATALASVGASQDGYVLAWSNGSNQWQASQLTESNLAGDVTGAETANTVVKLQNRTLNATAPNDQEAIVWSAADGYWKPAAVVTSTSAFTMGLAVAFANKLIPQ